MIDAIVQRRSIGGPVAELARSAQRSGRGALLSCHARIAVLIPGGPDSRELLLHLALAAPHRRLHRSPRPALTGRTRRSLAPRAYVGLVAASDSSATSPAARGGESSPVAVRALALSILARSRLGHYSRPRYGLALSPVSSCRFQRRYADRSLGRSSAPTPVLDRRQLLDFGARGPRAASRHARVLVWGYSPPMPVAGGRDERPTRHLCRPPIYLGDSCSRAAPRHLFFPDAAASTEPPPSRVGGGFVTGPQPLPMAARRMPVLYALIDRRSLSASGAARALVLVVVPELWIWARGPLTAAGVAHRGGPPERSGPPRRREIVGLLLSFSAHLRAVRSASRPAALSRRFILRYSRRRHVVGAPPPRGAARRPCARGGAMISTPLRGALPETRVSAS